MLAYVALAGTAGAAVISLAPGNPDPAGTLERARDGDEVVIDGSHTINRQIKPTLIGVKWTGRPGSQLRFNTPLVAGNGWIQGGNFAVHGGRADRFTMTGVNVHASGGVFYFDRFANSTITGNTFRWAQNSATPFYNKLVFWCGGETPNTIVDRNLFIDSPNSDRNLELWGWSGSYSYNRFHNVNDGGHVMDVRGEWKMIGNYGTRLHRMGIEIQHPCKDARIIIRDNVFDDTREPWNDTFGLSVMSREAAWVEVANNYLGTRFTGPWGTPGPSVNGEKRFGIAIETAWGADDATGNGVVEGNIVGGPNKWATVVAAATRNTLVRNNRVYGGAIWHVFGGEPGFWGMGSVADGGGNQNFPADQMPPRPAMDPRVPFITGEIPPITTIMMAVTPTAETRTGTAVLGWAGAPNGTERVRIEVRATGDHNITDLRVGPTLTYAVGAAPVTATGYHPGWRVDFRAVALAPDGTALASSAWVTVTFPGDSTQPWPPTVPPTQPTTQPGYDIVDTIVRQVRNGVIGPPTITSTTRPGN